MKKMFLVVLFIILATTICKAQYARWAEIEKITDVNRQLIQYNELNNRANAEIVLGSVFTTSACFLWFNATNVIPGWEERWKKYDITWGNCTIWGVCGGICMAVGIYELTAGINNKVVAKKGIEKCKLTIAGNGIVINF